MTRHKQTISQVKAVFIFIIIVTLQLKAIHGSLCNTYWRDLCSDSSLVSSTYDVTSNLNIATKASGNIGGCRTNIKAFVCQMIRHTCRTTVGDAPLPPCREACLRVRNTCMRRALHGSVSWAQLLNCNALPVKSSTNCHWSDVRSGGAGVETARGESTAQLLQRPVSEGTCSCAARRTTGVGRNVYYSKKFDYALQAQFTGVEHIPADNSPTVISVRVLQVLKQRSLHLQPGKMTLWSERGCYCSDLVPNKTYLILGYENSEKKRLLFNESSIAVPWKRRWPDYIEKWETHLRQYERRKLHRTEDETGVNHIDVIAQDSQSQAENQRPLDQSSHVIETDIPIGDTVYSKEKSSRSRQKSSRGHKDRHKDRS